MHPHTHTQAAFPSSHAVNGHPIGGLDVGTSLAMEVVIHERMLISHR